MSYFDFEKEKKSCTGTFEEDRIDRIKRAREECERKINLANEPIVFSSSKPMSKKEIEGIKNYKGHIEQPTTW